jgi:mRNA-degrading endonuclease toxin of MazEF toxin-antitoxin module
MPTTFYSDIETKRRTPSLYTVVDQAAVEQEVRYAEFRVTLTGTEVANDNHVLTSVLPADNIEIIPELSYVRKVTGTFSVTKKLQSVNAAGTATDLTTAVAYTGAEKVPYVAADALIRPVLGKTDALRVFLTVVTTTAAGAAFDVEIAYRKKR